MKITGMACWSYTNQHFKFHTQNRHHFPGSANTSSIRGVVSSESCAYLCARNDSCSEFSHSLVDKLCTLSRSCMTDTEWVLRIYDVHVDTVFTKGKIKPKIICSYIFVTSLIQFCEMGNQSCRTPTV